MMTQNKDVFPEKATHPRVPHPKEEDVTIISQTDIEYTAQAVSRFGTVLENIMRNNNFRIHDLLDRLSDKYFPNDCTISRLVNHDVKRLPNWGQAVELRRAFGIDLNALADGGNPLRLEQLSNDELAVRVEQVTAETSRRMRQK